MEAAAPRRRLDSSNNISTAVLRRVLVMFNTAEVSLTIGLATLVSFVQFGAQGDHFECTWQKLSWDLMLQI